MRSRVETRGFQMPMDVGDDCRRLSRKGHRRMCHLAVDVVHTEANALEMKRGDCARQCLRFRDERLELSCVRRIAA